MSDPFEVAAAQWSGMSGRVAFDVGAHRGENFRYLAGCGVTRIVAFEPEEARYAELEQLWIPDPLRPGPGRVEQDPVVTLNRSAVAAEAGVLEMRRANGMLGCLTGDEVVQVPSVTLDAAAGFYGPPDIVVVDVEGFEDQVLAGAERMLAWGRVSWLVEFHSEALWGGVCSVLGGAGYEPVTIRHPHYQEGSGLWRGHGWVKALRPG